MVQPTRRAGIGGSADLPAGEPPSARCGKLRRTLLCSRHDPRGQRAARRADPGVGPQAARLGCRHWCPIRVSGLLARSGCGLRAPPSRSRRFLRAADRRNGGRSLPGACRSTSARSPRMPAAVPPLVTPGPGPALRVGAENCPEDRSGTVPVDQPAFGMHAAVAAKAKTALFAGARRTLRHPLTEGLAGGTMVPPRPLSRSGGPCRSRGARARRGSTPAACSGCAPGAPRPFAR
jgi:hypothetical protein